MSITVEETGMIKTALMIAKTAKRESENIISFEDELGIVRVDLKLAWFGRFYNSKRRPYLYKPGSLSKAEKCYGTVNVRFNGEDKTIYQHILMLALTQPDGYEDGLEVGHKDSIKWNNTPGNLEWITSSQNRNMQVLVEKLESKYPGRYTFKCMSLHGDVFTASRSSINHSDIDKILAVIDDEDALDKELFKA